MFWKLSGTFLGHFWEIFWDISGSFLRNSGGFLLFLTFWLFLSPPGEGVKIARCHNRCRSPISILTSDSERDLTGTWWKCVKISNRRPGTSEIVGLKFLSRRVKKIQVWKTSKPLRNDAKCLRTHLEGFQMCSGSFLSNSGCF